MHAHGFLTRDHIEPTEFLRIGREQLATYGVEFRAAEATDARCLDSGGGRFRISLDDGATLESRKLLLATGVPTSFPTSRASRSCTAAASTTARTATAGNTAINPWSPWDPARPRLAWRSPSAPGATP